MFTLNVRKNCLTVHEKDVLTSGSRNVYRVLFLFDDDWDGLTKTAVFHAGDRTFSVLIDDTGKCVIPWEVLLTPNRRLEIGVYGTRDTDTVLPTVWADAGVIQQGAVLGEMARPPTPGIYEQLTAAITAKQDKLTGETGQLVGFDENGNAVPVAASTASSDPATNEEVDEMLTEVFGPLPVNK